MPLMRPGGKGHLRRTDQVEVVIGHRLDDSKMPNKSNLAFTVGDQGHIICRFDNRW